MYSSSRSVVLLEVHRVNLTFPSFAELDSLVLILSKVKESKAMSRAVKAGLSRESGRPHMPSLDSNGTVGIGITAVALVI